jgi:hypothetical protein
LRGPEHQAVLDKITPEQPASLTVALASGLTRDITGQVFIMRGNEIFVAGQGFPVKGVHQQSGWTPEEIANHAMPALTPGFTPPVGFVDYFSWGII